MIVERPALKPLPAGPHQHAAAGRDAGFLRRGRGAAPGRSDVGGGPGAHAEQAAHLLQRPRGAGLGGEGRDRRAHPVAHQSGRSAGRTHTIEGRECHVPVHKTHSGKGMKMTTTWDLPDTP